MCMSIGSYAFVYLVNVYLVKVWGKGALGSLVPLSELAVKSKNKNRLPTKNHNINKVINFKTIVSKAKITFN